MSLTPERLCALAGSGLFPEFAWLDGGGEESSWVGLRAEMVVETDSLDVLDEVEQLWRSDPSAVWIGWVTYDLGAAALRGQAAPRLPLPGLVMRRYANAARVDANSSVRWFGEPIALPVGSEAEDESAAWPTGPLRAQLDADEYRARVVRALGFIGAGDTYQVNLSQGFFAEWLDEVCSMSVAGRAARLYGAMRKRTPASMGALVHTPAGWLVSNSPETLVDLRIDSAGGVLRSCPIKGTRPRGATPEDDARLAAQLQSSTKDAAEHVMIVDLVRNDLGRLAQPGSVTAPASPNLVTLPTVHHLVSEVFARVEPGWSLRELFAGLFPGGSVTGAPKHRTIEIIGELEDGPREIYCGGIVLLEPEGLKVSIPIRTGIADATGLRLRSGGGIVADSDPEAERRETVHKARAFQPPAERAGAEG